MTDQDNNYSDEIDLMALVGTLWRGKWRIAAVALVCTVLGLCYAVFVATPMYTSSTTVVVADSGGSVIDIEAVTSGISSESDSLNTEAQVLESRSLLETLADKMELQNDPEFNTFLRPEPLISVGKIIRFVTGKALKTPTDRGVKNRVVDNLRNVISTSVRRSTFIISITVTTSDADKSRDIANTLAELYLDQQISVKFSQLEEAVTWLSARVVELEGDIEQQNSTLKTKTAEANYVNAEGLQALNLQVRELRERLIAEQNDAERAAAYLQELIAVASSQNADAILSFTKDPTLSRIAAAGEIDLSTQSDGAFQARLETIIGRTQKDVERARTQVGALFETIEAMELRVNEQATKLSELQNLEREVESTGILHNTFLTRLKETTIQQGIQHPDARVLSAAIVGTKVAPRESMIGALSLILGLLIGSALVLLREMRANGFRNADDLQKDTNLQVIGQIPLFPVGARGDLIQYLKDKPTSPAVEAVRNLRTSILLSDVDNPPKIIMSTSTIPGEGKTTQAISLVQNLTGMGKKVLLIEGDIRRRTLDEYFKAEANEHGLLSVVSGDATLAEAVINSERLNADVLMGQVSHINAADVFSSEKFVQFLDSVREAYDYVIIDTPPVLVVPDARVIGQHCDAIMYTVKWDSTTKTQVLAALRELAAVNLKPTGLVLSQINPKGMKKYGYGEAYGAYSSYGGGYYDA